jgi:quercetin dioxygenase-like cupin family protein
MTTSETKIRVVSSTEGLTLGVAGDHYRVIISGEQTNNTYSVFDMLVPPAGGPAPHSHRDIQEFFYVLEGEFRYKIKAGQG